MAELNNDAVGASPDKKISSRKLGSRVDLTAMVDLAFLLITFFMLTTSLTKPQSLQLAMPDANGAPAAVDENRTMTLLIGDHNTARCFMGKEFSEARKIALGTRDLRKEINARKKQVLAYSTAQGHPEKGLIVLIKPDHTSKYGNLIDVLDEMAITDVPSYAIESIDPKESALLASR